MADKDPGIQLKAARELEARQFNAFGLFRGWEKQAAFFKSDASEILVRGGNRSSKSTICATLFAAIALDRQIQTLTGERVEARKPHQKGRPLLMWCIGLQINHIGDTLYRLLFRPGMFKVIRDQETGEWRTWMPWIESDLQRESETKPAPPLIPPSEIEQISWSNKGARQFTHVTLKNGTIICAYPSTGDVKAGDPVDVIWIDEAIRYVTHYPEWQARLSDNRGRLFWSSWPAMGNTALTALTERAQWQAEEVANGEREEADVEEYVFVFSDNPYIAENEKRKRLEGWDEDERRARDLGEYTTDTLRIYGNFSKEIHCAIYRDPAQDDVLADCLRKNNGYPPRDWTRDLILDPGTTKAGVLFCAVPPPIFGPYLVVYDEIFVRRKDASQLAEIVLGKTTGQYFQRFIIDMHAARQTPMGFGKTVGTVYSDEFFRRRLSCRETGSQFSPGSDDILGRISLVRQAMAVGHNGRPALRIVTQNCPNLVKQLNNYSKEVTADGDIKETPAKKQVDELPNCLEYWISRSPNYVRPEITDDYGNDAFRAFNRKKRHRELKEREGNPQTVRLGPGPVTYT